ncbi:hypothetical protein GCM10017083_11180 [Thalassobaculum fulvum]|uniref:VWFA domain-containing protein n=1 Tax=Thalassobaculum fulvum TaxID=1633335 RepID=A0A918XQ95_9PROT|nr:VWA domain-containing protein [Thalassobaculum fulvum]GHD44117.1 hypothetical protein GCM10017083_11180 [Thalassobaculum fulvum]
MRTIAHRAGAMAALAAIALLAGCETQPDHAFDRALGSTAVAPAPAGPSPARARAQGLFAAPALPPLARNRESYQPIDSNPVRLAAEHPVSTFGVDVDTGSYSNVRRFLNAGTMPPADAVRVEELVNYFDYGYARPADAGTPFAVTTEVARTPWNPDSFLLQIGIKGYDIDRADRPAANLVFLVDVSGSMQARDKLPLVVQSLKMLTDQLTARDRIAVVTYAGRAGTVLEPTPGDRKAEIRAALDGLQAGGGTAGGAGLKRAYELAERARIDGGVNRVLLATDGDFNVGVSDVGQLRELIAAKRRTGITLTTLGFGTGNYQEALMEQIADVGNGNYAYIDGLAEARKVLVNEMSSTLFTIAQDVKVQVEFNPAKVAEYRLIGFENRVLKRADFNNDRVDAGDIGAGHTVTALYEIVPAGGRGSVDPLRYGTTGPAAVSPDAAEFAFLKLRYKLPGQDRSRLIEQPLAASLLEGSGSIEASADLRFAAAVAAFGQILRGGEHTGGFDYGDVLELARGARGDDPLGYRAGFLTLVDLARGLQGS